MGQKVKALLSDNSVDYVSSKFKNLYSAEGIKWDFTTPHNPQHNRVAERKNRSIVGVARAMLHDQGLPLHSSNEACKKMSYV